MSPDVLQFPCLCIHKGTMFTAGSADSLTSTTAKALRGGLFQDLRILDCEGRELRVMSARKLHGIGPLWGFNVFLNQRIRVDLEVEPTGKKHSTAEIKKIVSHDFTTWQGWASRQDFEQLERAVASASSVSEVIHLITSNRA